MTTLTGAAITAITEPGYLPVGCRQGDAYAFLVHLVTKNDGGDLVDLDLSTFDHFSAQVRPRPGASAVESFTINDVDLVTGRCTLRLTGAQTRRCAAEGVWDLQIVDSAGEGFTLLEGPANFPRQATRP